jgi:hypothetical protein
MRRMCLPRRGGFPTSCPSEIQFSVVVQELEGGFDEGSSTRLRDNYCRVVTDDDRVAESLIRGGQ